MEKSSTVKTKSGNKFYLQNEERTPRYSEFGRCVVYYSWFDTFVLALSRVTGWPVSKCLYIARYVTISTIRRDR
ncbi:hypothetical protein EMVG_00046 [Emiliania huxleyi virus PS401]|nr:hypothetical protein EMVG_00046 [Emiliania huxleyi virus PS401]